MNPGQKVKVRRRVISVAISMCFEWKLMNGMECLCNWFEGHCVLAISLFLDQQYAGLINLI